MDEATLNWIAQLLNGQVSAPNTLPSGLGFATPPTQDVSQVPAPALGGQQGMLYPTISPNPPAQPQPLSSLAPLEQSLPQAIQNSGLYQAQQQMTPQELAIFRNGPMGGDQETQALGASQQRIQQSQGEDEARAFKQQLAAQQQQATSSDTKLKVLGTRASMVQQQLDNYNQLIVREATKAGADAVEKAVKAAGGMESIDPTKLEIIRKQAENAWFGSQQGMKAQADIKQLQDEQKKLIDQFSNDPDLSPQSLAKQEADLAAGYQQVGNLGTNRNVKPYSPNTSDMAPTDQAPPKPAAGVKQAPPSQGSIKSLLDQYQQQKSAPSNTAPKVGVLGGTTTPQQEAEQTGMQAAMAIIQAGIRKGLTPPQIIAGVKGDKSVPPEIAVIIEQFAGRF